MSLIRPDQAVSHIEIRTGCPGIVSAETLKRWRFRHRGPEFIRLGGRIYYSREKLDRWLAETGVALPDECTKMDAV